MGYRQRKDPPGLLVWNSAKARALESSCQHPSLSANLTLQSDDLERHLWRRKARHSKTQTTKQLSLKHSMDCGFPKLSFLHGCSQLKNNNNNNALLEHKKLGTKGLRGHVDYYKWPRDDGYVHYY